MEVPPLANFLESGALREIAMRASTEMDPEKLAALVQELCLEMDRADSRAIPVPLTRNTTELAAIDALCRELTT